MEPKQYFLIVIGILILLFLTYLIKTYNALIKSRNRVKTQWSQIDVQLMRRADLIPNLVECVKGYAKHEKETIDCVIQARSAMTSANSQKDLIEANSILSSALPKLFALAEAYPELKANTNFLQMQSDLKDTEDKIAYARQFYNDTVLLYKDKIGQFPTNIFASILGFKEEDFIVPEDIKKNNISINL